MSVMLLGTENYTYLKEKITKLLMYQTHTRYNLKALQEIGMFNEQILLEYINKKVNELQQLNTESFYKQKISRSKIILGRMPTNQQIEAYKNIYYMDSGELLEISDVINCTLYQIEIDFNDDFIKTVQLHLLKEVAENTKELLRLDTKWGI